MNRLGRWLDLIRRRGALYPLELLSTVALPRLLWAPLRSGSNRTRTVVERWARRSRAPLPQARPLLEGALVATLDGDGRALGTLDGFPSVAPEDFLPRRRFDLTVHAGNVGLFVRKGYRGDHSSWRRELTALDALERAGVAAPRVLGFEVTSTTTDKSLFAGPTLRDLLVSEGADILSSSTDRDPALNAVLDAEKLELVWSRGRLALARLPRLLPALESSLDAVHRAGVTGPALTFGNVVVPEVGPMGFIDFDSATVHRSTTSLRFAAARDYDRRLFNRIYGTRLLTETTAAELVREVGRTNYAPLDLGQGLATRGFWSVDSGTGRWEYLNGQVLAPLLPGARVLDLGSHNGLMPLLMLRDGARSVVAVERDPELVEHARRLHQLFEWRAMRPLDLEVRNSDMLAAIRAAEGPFDLVTAFCSLYYLNEDDMAETIRHAARLAPTLVLQAKTDTRLEAAEGKAAKSLPEFLQRLLTENGFASVQTTAPPGFSRPILVARRT